MDARRPCQGGERHGSGLIRLAALPALSPLPAHEPTRYEAGQKLRGF